MPHNPLMKKAQKDRTQVASHEKYQTKGKTFQLIWIVFG
jgi:hypothetical protein